MRVRIDWGGSRSLWHGTIAVDRGTITEFRALGVEADEVGSMWIDKGQVHVQQRSPRTYDGIDVAISAPLDAKLIIRLSTADRASTVKPIEFSLSSLVDEFKEAKLDDQGNRLVARRAPGDKLRVQLANPTLVLAPGEPLTFELTPHLVGLNVIGDIQITTEVLTARDDHSWSETTQTIQAPQGERPGAGIPLQVIAPRQEGVYDLVITAWQSIRRRGLAQVNPLADSTKQLAQRKVQFVVLGDEVPAVEESASAPTVVIDEIQPSVPWWEQVTKLQHIPGLKKGPLSNGEVKKWDHPRFGELTAIGPSPADDERNWVAYPIDVKEPGQVHVLEIEYPIDQPQKLSISVLEPNAAGNVIPASLDSGVHVPKHAAGDSTKLGVHRLIFWPRSEAPIVLLTNVSHKTRATFGKIRVLGPKKQGSALLRIGSSARSHLPKAEGFPAIEGGRLLAAYLQKPHLPETFSASEALDLSTGRNLDDWITFYEGGSRAVSYLNHIGYNTLVISALSSGSTLYPSKFLQPTPQYDSGDFFATGQDPIRKDVLEMLFQMCDREGLKLIPALDFSSPLPALEAQLRGRGADDGIQLIGGKGRTWIEEHGTIRGRAAYYNPLNQQVQSAMLDVVREITERYRHHPSFAGLMISTAGDSYALLPGEEWALDDDTVGRFSRDTGIPVPGGGPERFAARATFVQGSNRDHWLAWRAQQIQTLLTEMRKHVEMVGPQTKLFIAAEGMYTSSEVEQATRPVLPDRTSDKNIPLSMGIDISSFRGDSRIVILRPRSIAPVPTAADDAVRRQLNDSDQLDAIFATAAQTGSLFLHQAHRQRLTSFDKVSPFGADKTFVSLASQLLPSGAENRRRFVHSLAIRDEQIMIDGGDFLPLGQESAAREVLAVFRQLPPVSFETLPMAEQPIVIRTASYNGSTYVYVVNDSAWPVTVDLNAEGPNTRIEDLRDRNNAPQLDGGRLVVRLAPYDLAAYRFGTDNMAFSHGNISVAEEAQVDLARRIDELVSRATALGVPKTIEVLKNPGFEQAAVPNNIAGWTFSGGAGSKATLDARYANNGQHSVKLSSSGQLALLVSEAFTMPATGRLAFSVWLRAEPDKPAPDLRLAVGGKQANGQEYYRFGKINGLNRFKNATWEHIQFQVDDLPLGGQGELQVRFDLMGAGTVWIDDVQVSSLHFSADERTQLSRLITKAHLLLEDKRFSDCAKLLRGYWPAFLEDHVEVPEARMAAAQPTPTPKADKAAEPKEPWWKQRLPSFLK